MLCCLEERLLGAVVGNERWRATAALSVVEMLRGSSCRLCWGFGGLR
jgi:hypothetical protein